MKLKIKQTSQHVKKARAPPRHSLGRDLLRGREAVPQDVAEVQPTRGAHEDLEHVHLEGAGRGVAEQPAQLGPREPPPEPRGPRVRARRERTSPAAPQPVRRFLHAFLSLTRGRPLRRHCTHTTHARLLRRRCTHTTHKRSIQARRGGTMRVEASKPQGMGAPRTHCVHATRGEAWSVDKTTPQQTTD